MAANDEESIIRDRLLLDPKAEKKLFSRFRALVDTSKVSKSAQEGSDSEPPMDLFAVELNSLRSSMTNRANLCAMGAQETSEFALKTIQNQELVAETNSEIDLLKIQLKEAQQVKANHIACDSIARQARKYLTRDELNRYQTM